MIGPSTPRPPDDRPEHPRVRPLVGLHAWRAVRRVRVALRVGDFLPAMIGTTARRAEADAPSTGARARASPADAARTACPFRAQLLDPVLRMPPLGRRQPAIDLRQPRVLFVRGERLVERGGVELVLNEEPRLRG